MKKFLALIIFLCIGLAACSYENDNNDYHNYIQQSDLHSGVLTRNTNITSLQAALTFSNEFGIGFLLRNETGQRLYYNDDFRVDSLQMTNRHNRAGIQFISHGDTKQTHVNWDASRPTGIHTFERDFFLDSDLAEFYKTLAFEFYVIGWYHFTDDAEPIPEDLQARRDARVREYLAFQISDGASAIIVLASEVAVSRTEVAFNTANLSTQPFMHGLDYRLLIYENGWKDAPTILDSWGVPSIGIGMQGGEVIEDRFNFEWLYGMLANGRYMIMRHHSEDHMRPGTPRVQETLMVEFIIDDNTPMSLDNILPVTVNLSVYACEITPTGLQLYVTNYTSHKFLYNGPFIVQKYVYGIWENIYELAIPMRYQIPVYANDTVSISANWAEHFGKLPPGQYQLISHFNSADTGLITMHVFYISQETFDEYIGDTQLNPMFQQNVVITDVAVTPAGMTIRWENTSDRIFYTPPTHFWVEGYSPEEGRSPNRLREAFVSTFSGPDTYLRQVTIEMSGGSAMTFDTTAVHPGHHVNQTINWGHELPAGQYVISLGHFNPDEPGFMFWITSWERFVLRFFIN